MPNPMMPMTQPRTPTAQWASALNNWNAGGRENYPPDYMDYGIGGNPEEMDLINFFLSALFSEEGKGKYKSKLGAGRGAGLSPTPSAPPAPKPPDAIAAGVDDIKTREEKLEEMKRRYGI